MAALLLFIVVVGRRNRSSKKGFVPYQVGKRGGDVAPSYLTSETGGFVPYQVGKQGGNVLSSYLVSETGGFVPYQVGKQGGEGGDVLSLYLALETEEFLPYQVYSDECRKIGCIQSRLWQAWITSSMIQSSIAVEDYKIQVKVPWKIQNTRMAGSDYAVYNRYPDKSIPAVSAHSAKPQCAKPQCAKPQLGIGVCVGSPVHDWGAGSPPFEQEP